MESKEDLPVPGLSSKIRTSVNLSPAGSHVVIVSLVGVDALCFLSAFIFIWHNKNYWPPFGVACALLLIIAFLWLRSHRHIDDGSSSPLVLSKKEGDTSTKISIPLRGMHQRQLAALYERMLSTFQNRKPLPEPDGLIDDEGQPVPDSVGEARQQVEAVNHEWERVVDTLENRPSFSPQFEEGAQPASIVAPEPSQLDSVNRKGDR